MIYYYYVLHAKYATTKLLVFIEKTECLADKNAMVTAPTKVMPTLIYFTDSVTVDNNICRSQS